MAVLRHSDGNATAALTPNPKGILLVDPDDNTRVKISGTDAPDFSIREVGTTYDIIGSRIPVRITDSVGGYSGSVSGFLRGPTRRDSFLTLKGRLKALRLILSDINIEIRLEEVTGPSPRGDVADQDLYDVSFSFFQTDPQNTFSIRGGFSG